MTMLIRLLLRSRGKIFEQNNVSPWTRYFHEILKITLFLSAVNGSISKTTIFVTFPPALWREIFKREKS